jgi:dinuclear metal center YbgI/SA1388 family protein
MKVTDLVNAIESFAPLSLQESYDNCGLITGNLQDEVHACLVTLDVTENVISEAVDKGCGMIISHHPVIFGKVTRLTGATFNERVIIRAIRENIALYAAHTNLDNINQGVNSILGEKIGLKNLRILKKTGNQLRKLVTFCPSEYADRVRIAISEAGAGHIGNYDYCSFNSEGIGTFRANENAHPFVGEINEIHKEHEVRIETVYPVYREREILKALLEVHPYEEVAYDLYPIANEFENAGDGMIGILEEEEGERAFLGRLKHSLGIPMIRHSNLQDLKIRKVAVCGGSGSFLLPDAISADADAFVTADLKYHQFFEAQGHLLLADVGHFESEQFMKELITRYLNKIFPKFALLISETATNAVNYF